MKTVKIYLLTLLCTFPVIWAQQACDPLDQGPYLATHPRLDFNVREVTTEGLQNAPLYQKDWYRSELRITGDYQAGDYEVKIDSFSFLNPLDYFQIVSEDDKTFLKLKTGIDRDGHSESLLDDISIINFKLTCIPKANPTLTKVYDAQIYVEDVNDNAPVFSNINSRLDIYVIETLPVHTLLTTIKATDRDLNLDKNLTFSLGTHMDKFSINPQSGELVLQTPLDYDKMEQNKYFDVVVNVEDGGPSPFQRVSGVVRVHVQDADDQGPVFEYSQCWRHLGVCSWPKYTTGLTLTKDRSIVLQPVPNKGQGPVEIVAQDQDSSRSKINFKIASTIPPGHEDKFTLETTKAADGAYKTQIVPKETMTVNEGFEIFLKAEEDTPAKRFVVSMIYFTDGSNSGGNQGSTDSTGAESDPFKQVVEDDDEYSDRELALIVVTAILATIIVGLIIALIYSCRRKGFGKSKDLPVNGHFQHADTPDSTGHLGSFSNPAFNTSM